MLAPKKVKFRKQQKGRNRGKATRGNGLAFGDRSVLLRVHLVRRAETPRATSATSPLERVSTA